jgi:choice-of-anchor A domain-containing protein
MSFALPTSRSLFVRLAAAAPVVLLAGSAFAQSNTYMRDWSLISFGNAFSSSNNQGRAMIGGTLTGGASDYGTRLTPASNFLGQDVLRVGGAISTQNINMAAGNIRHGSTVSGNTNFNGGGQRVADPNTAALANLARVALTADSAFYRTLPATSSVTIPVGQPAGVTFNPVPTGPNNLAVFNLPAGFFAANTIQSIGINPGTAAAILINVPGTSINFSSGANFTGNFTTDSVRAKFLWNFYEATTINFQGKAFEGAVLAPLAALTHQGVISGSVAVASISQQSEIHLPGFSAIIPAPQAAGPLALLALAALRRRR